MKKQKLFFDFSIRNETYYFPKQEVDESSFFGFTNAFFR